jgi:hypothetical protein
MPVHLESTNEANTVENIDGDKFYVAKNVLKVLGYIQKEENFEITKTSRKPRFGINLS